MTTFQVDQSKITTPGFPRPFDWWRGFIPQWAKVEIACNGAVLVSVPGSPARGRALGEWLREVGTSGFMADAVTEL